MSGGTSIRVAATQADYADTSGGTNQSAYGTKGAVYVQIAENNYVATIAADIKRLRDSLKAAGLMA